MMYFWFFGLISLALGILTGETLFQIITSCNFKPDCLQCDVGVILVSGGRAERNTMECVDPYEYKSLDHYLLFE